jgi:hypothetical protein
MKLWFAWVGHKKDGAGKSHLWGILNRDEDHTTQRYIFWCSVGVRKTNVHLSSRTAPWADNESSFSKARQKENQGYKQITQEVVENRWPQVMDDIEMQFVMERLTE